MIKSACLVHVCRVCRTARIEEPPATATSGVVGWHAWHHVTTTSVQQATPGSQSGCAARKTDAEHAPQRCHTDPGGPGGWWRLVAHATKREMCGGSWEPGHAPQCMMRRIAWCEAASNGCKLCSRKKACADLRVLISTKKGGILDSDHAAMVPRRCWKQWFL